MVCETSRERRRGESLRLYTNEERVTLIRVALARKRLTHGAIASALGKDRQNVSRIALSGKTGLGCDIRQALAKVVGIPCADLWACGPEMEVDNLEEEEVEEGETRGEVGNNGQTQNCGYTSEGLPGGLESAGEVPGPGGCTGKGVAEQVPGADFESGMRVKKEGGDV